MSTVNGRKTVQRTVTGVLVGLCLSARNNTSNFGKFSVHAMYGKVQNNVKLCASGDRLCDVFYEQNEASCSRSDWPTTEVLHDY